MSRFSFNSTSIILMAPAALLVGFTSNGCVDSAGDQRSAQPEFRGVIENPLMGFKPDWSDTCPGVPNPPDHWTGQWCDTRADCDKLPSIFDGVNYYHPGVECTKSFEDDNVTIVDLGESAVCDWDLWTGYWKFNEGAGWHGDENPNQFTGHCMVQSDDNWDGVGNACTVDKDGDHICDGDENQTRLWYDPAICDDYNDNCVSEPNHDQADFDVDGKGNSCDEDCDGDRVNDLTCEEHFPNTECDGVAPPPECDGSDDCDDGNACTNDWCKDGSCDHDDNVTASCDDGDNCTVDDYCDGGECISGTPMTCTPENNCTTSWCDDGKCVSDDVDCNDHDACTEDTCDPATGCGHTAVSVDDSNACTVDACTSEVGVTHTPLNCDDENNSTTDTCDPATGCVHTPTGSCETSADCNDSDWGTYDTCVSLVCHHDPGVHIQASSSDTSQTWKIHFYYNGTETVGTLPYEGTLLKTSACEWGVDIAVSDNPGSFYWDCLTGVGYVKASLLTVTVDGVVKTNESVTRPSACGGAAPGNLWLSDETGDNDLSCPTP